MMSVSQESFYFESHLCSRDNRVEEKLVSTVASSANPSGHSRDAVVSLELTGIKTNLMFGLYKDDRSIVSSWRSERTSTFKLIL